MNPFVDNQKRSVELPFGCKDITALMREVDEPSGRKSTFKLVNGLHEAERYVTALLLTPGKLTYLSIRQLPRFQHHLELSPVRDSLCFLIRIDGRDQGRLQVVSSLFASASISPIVDCDAGLMNHLPFRLLIYPAPADGSDAAELLVRLLRDGFAVPDDAQLYFSSNEKTIA